MSNNMPGKVLEYKLPIIFSNEQLCLFNTLDYGYKFVYNETLNLIEKDLKNFQYDLNLERFYSLISTYKDTPLFGYLKYIDIAILKSAIHEAIQDRLDNKAQVKIYTANPSVTIYSNIYDCKIDPLYIEFPSLGKVYINASGLQNNIYLNQPTKSITIYYTSTFGYIASICKINNVEVFSINPLPYLKDVGIYVGTDPFLITLSTSKQFKFSSKHIPTIQQLQRFLNEYNKDKDVELYKRTLQSIKEKIFQDRNEWYKSIISDLVSKYDVIYVMEPKHSNALNNITTSDHPIYVSTWDNFIVSLQHRMRYRNKCFLLLPNNDQIIFKCSQCQHINHHITNVIWTCNVCNTTHDLNINVAKNIYMMGKSLVNYENSTPHLRPHI